MPSLGAFRILFTHHQQFDGVACACICMSLNLLCYITVAALWNFIEIHISFCCCGHFGFCFYVHIAHVTRYTFHLIGHFFHSIYVYRNTIVPCFVHCLRIFSDKKEWMCKWMCKEIVIPFGHKIGEKGAIPVNDLVALICFSFDHVHPKIECISRLFAFGVSILR